MSNISIQSGQDQGSDPDTGVVPIIELIKKDGINQRSIDILKTSGFYTVESVAQSNTKILCQIDGISEEEAGIFLKEAVGLCHSGFVSAEQILEASRDLVYFTTGSKALDKLLGGGIRLASLTAVQGYSGSGKTQLCHTLAVTCQLDGNKSVGRCIYIDSAGSFRPERLIQIVSHYKLDMASVLANILVAKPLNTDHQIDLLHEVACMMTKKRFSLIVVDSVNYLYRTHYNSFRDMSERQQHMTKYFRLLNQMVQVHKVAVVITSEVDDRLDETLVASDELQRSIARILLIQAHNKRRSFKVCGLDSALESEAEFTITTSGISDSKSIE